MLPIEIRLYDGAICRVRKVSRGTSQASATYGPKRGEEMIVLYLGTVKKDAPLRIEELLNNVGLTYQEDDPK